MPVSQKFELADINIKGIYSMNRDQGIQWPTFHTTLSCFVLQKSNNYFTCAFVQVICLLYIYIYTFGVCFCLCLHILMVFRGSIHCTIQICMIIRGSIHFG